MCQSLSPSSSLVSVLILANGKSTRFGSDKLSVKIEGEFSVLEKTVSLWNAHPEISEIYIIGKKNFLSPNIRNKYKKFSGFISGGKTRYESFSAGIEFFSEKKNQKILIHNAANPFVTHSEISAVIAKITKNTAVGVGRKTTNTLRKWDRESSQIIPRDEVYAMETPQGAFLSDFIDWNNKQKIKQTNQIKFKNSVYSEITDELMLAEENSGNIYIVPASPENIKITYKNDISFQKIPVTGFGIDSHRFEPEYNSDTPCVLCGIEIKNTPKFSGNSDADVALHALCNALLSGIGENSFSNIATPLCKNGEKNSEVYLQKILELVAKKEKKILHLVLSFEGKRPKIEKYFPQFRQNLAMLLSLSPENIGLNATTGEEIDGYGRGEGMKVSAVVTMI